MQVISVIGHVAGKLEEVESAGRRFLRFRVNADGNADGSEFVYTVVTSRIALQEKLYPKADVYVSGHLTISSGQNNAATIQALVIQVMEPAKKTAGELNMEHFVNRIQLQDI